VPELLQDDATAEKIAKATLELVNDKEKLATIKSEFTDIHYQLKQNTAEKAAIAVLSHLK